MAKLTQHGAFDADSERRAREELLTEFTEGRSWADACGDWSAEDFGEIADGFDFAQLCQKPDGKIYGTQGQCRKGTPISYRPGDRQGDVYNKGRAAGMRVESILDENKRLRLEKGLKMVKGPEAVQSLVRRLNQRMGVAQKPDDQKNVKTPEQAAKAAKPPETPSRQASQALRDLVKAGDRLDARAAQSAADRLQAARAAAEKPAWQRERDVMNRGPADPAGQEKQLKFNLRVAQNKGTQSQIVRAQNELREFRKQQRMVKEAARPGAKPAAAKPAANAAKEKPSMQVNARFLKKETTQKLQEYLDGRKLYAYQRKAIEEELKRREKAGQADVRVRREAPKAAAPKASLGDRAARKAAIDDVNRQIEAIRRRRNEPAYQKPDQKKFLDSLEIGLVRRRMDIEAGVALPKAGAKSLNDTSALAKRALQPGSAGREARLKLGEKVRLERAKAGIGPEVASAKPARVDQKLLQAPTDKLQAILRRGDLGAGQRKKIEEELGGRGVTPARPVKITAGMTTDAAVKAGWKLDRAVRDYDPIAVYSQTGNQLLAKGAFGAAYRTDGPPPGVIKQGKIGEHEAEVWQKLQGTGRVPEFHGAVVSPNMRVVGSGYGGHVKEGSGYLGIGEAKGVPVAKYSPRTNEERNKVLEEYIRARRDIHLAGVAHNDMHGNNVFYDKATGRMQLIDFGLAQPSYKAALMEAFGTNQGDWQSERFIGNYSGRGGEAPAYYRFRRNQERVNRALEELDIDTNRMRGMGIRNKPEHIDRVLNGMSEQAAKAYVEMLYEGV
jgi:hypothetical protein